VLTCVSRVCRFVWRPVRLLLLLLLLLLALLLLLLLFAATVLVCLLLALGLTKEEELELAIVRLVAVVMAVDNTSASVCRRSGRTKRCCMICTDERAARLSVFFFCGMYTS
jgi:hypothetical protein